jgi:hypothetical protein
MNPCFSAFADEVLLIKQAEAEELDDGPTPASAAPVVDEERPFKSQLPTLAKSRLKSAIKFGLGHGLGLGTGTLLGHYLLPKVLPKTWTPTTQKYVGTAIGGMGALGALAMWDAMEQAAKTENNDLQRNN